MLDQLLDITIIKIVLFLNVLPLHHKKELATFIVSVRVLKKLLFV